METIDPQGVTIKNRDNVLLERRQNAKLVARHANSVVSQHLNPTSENRTSCFGKVGSVVGRLFLSCRRVDKHHRLHADEMAATSQSASLFGQRSKKTSAVTTSLQVSGTITRRIEDLEERAAFARDDATAQFKSGNKGASLRALKRSKAIEKQLQSLISAQTAIESQSDMLETADLQRDVANALSAGGKGMKNSQTTLKGVEAIVDDAQDARDGLDEIRDVLHSIGETFDDGPDEESLLEELAQMSKEPTRSAPTAVQIVSSSKDPVPAAIASHETHTFPDVPKTPVSEYGMLNSQVGLPLVSSAVPS